MIPLKPRNIKYLEPIRDYTSNGYTKINSLMFKICTATHDIIETLDFTADYTSYKNIFNLYLTYLNVDNSKRKKEYIITESKRPLFNILTKESYVEKLSVGDKFVTPYFASTSISIPFHFEEKALGYTFYVIIPTTEKYLFLDGKYRDESVTTMPNEKEILLPPGTYTVIDIINDDKYKNYNICFVLDTAGPDIEKIFPYGL